MIKSNKYYQQLDNLKIAIQEKCPILINHKEVIFHHDNAKPHILQNRSCANQRNWNGILYHTHLSPIIPSPIIPSDYLTCFDHCKRI